MAQQNIPKLRFPEFSGEWEKVSIADLGKFSGGGTPSSGKLEYWIGNIPWISSSDLSEDNMYFIKMSRFINEKAIKDSATKLIPKGSICIVSRVGVGKVALTSTELCTSQDFINLIPDKNNNAVFLAYSIKNLTAILKDFNQGTSIKGFVKSDFIGLEIQLPLLLEQQKIASFLSAVDKKIELLQKKIELLGR